MSKSWDKFRIQKPFSRVAIIYGEPIFVGTDIDGLALENYKIKVRDSLEELEALAVSYFENEALTEIF